MPGATLVRFRRNVKGPRGTIRVVPDAPQVPVPSRAQESGDVAIGEHPTEPTPFADEPFDPRRTRGFDEDAPSLLPGDRLADLTVESLLNRGGIGEVYVAKNPVLDKTFALKILSRRYRERQDVRERMLVEARALAQFPDHDGIVKVFAAGLDPVLGPYIVMELLKGKTLRELIRLHHGLGVPRAVAMAILVATITDDLHAVSIVHRDLKPENIFMVPAPDGSFRLVVLDLGCVKSPYSGKTTDRACAMGTVRYMSPEQLMGLKVTPRSDQFALAHILYELLLGEHAFEELARNVGGSTPLQEAGWQTMGRIQPLPPSICPPALWAVLERLYAHDPDHRYGSMKEVASALRSYLASIVQNRSDEVIRGLAEHPQMTPTPGGRAAPRPSERAQNRVLLPANAQPSARAGAGANGVTSPRKTVTKNPAVALTSLLAVPSLLVLDADGRPQKRFVLGAGATLGRDRDEADIMIDEPSVSRRHALLELDDAQAVVYRVADLGSRNGTEIGGHRTRYGYVEPGEDLLIGDVRVTVVGPGRFDETGRFFPQAPRRGLASHPPAGTPPQRTLPDVDALERELRKDAVASRALPVVLALIGIVLLAIAWLLLARFGVLPQTGLPNLVDRLTRRAP